MKTTLNLFAALALIASATAMTKHTQSVTAQTSVTIPNATHGIGSRWIGVAVYDQNGAVQPKSSYNATVNTSTYSVTVSWDSAFTGSVQLSGPWPSSDTELKFNYESASSSTFTVCPDAENNAQRLTYGGKRYGCANRVIFDRYSSAARDVYVYADGDSKLVFCETGSNGLGTVSGGHGVVTGGCASGFPSGVLPLFKFSTWPNIGNITDYRPW